MKVSGNDITLDIQSLGGICIVYQNTGTYQNLCPAMLRIRNAAGCVEEYDRPYTQVERMEEGTFLCKALVETRNKSRFLFIDKIAIDCNKSEILVDRSVEVLNADSHDFGFSTEFGLCKREDTAGYSFGRDAEVFVPGIWYKQNRGVVKDAFAPDMYHKNYYFRITRMALPYIQLGEMRTGSYFSFVHAGAEPDVGIVESDAACIIDETLQYGSLGITVDEEPMLKYIYPGSEGDVNYLDKSVSWAYRHHPVRTGVKHAYRLRIHFGSGRDSYDRMRTEWRRNYEMYQPELYTCDLKQAYEDGVSVLDTYCQEYNGVMGIPFWATVPEGTVCDISFQMGFVGQQLQCAYQLLKYGVEQNKADRKEKARKIVDFWVNMSMRDSYLPQVWYDVFPAGFKPDYPTYFRTMADGMEGILTCYLYLKKHGEDHKAWLEFCLNVADRLHELQNQDGSFYRAYGRKGEAVHCGKYNTSNIIRFLVNLFFATGEEKYAEMAKRAGEFCYHAVFEEMSYIGGTADNDNTIDKEAGMLALYAFLALYDLTKEDKWVKAASGAADFCETWTYSWQFPVHPYKGNAVFDHVNQTGLSLIATGHSHCDVMMGYCPFDYFRLYRLTGDPHYYDFGCMILYNTKQTTDCMRTHHHVHPGLVEESGELAKQYHNGLGKWLPWCTIAEIEALTRLQEWFGSMEPKAEHLLLERNKNYSQFFDV